MAGRTRNVGFPNTCWTLVVEAQRKGDVRAEAALADLCRRYWYPLYSFARRSGSSPEDAEDLTQHFFERMMERGMLEKVDRERGRLRSFLLAAFKNVRSEVQRRSGCEKRGGKAETISIDAETAEARYGRELASADLTPAEAWERSWAVTLLGGVLDDVAADYRARGKGEQFEALKPHLAWNASDRPLAETAEQLGMSEVSLRVTIHRLRKRYRKRLEERIGETVACADDVGAELEHLLAIFQSGGGRG